MAPKSVAPLRSTLGAPSAVFSRAAGSKRGRDFQTAEVGADAGSAGAYGGRAAHGDRLAGGLEYPETQNGVAHGLDWERAYTAFFEVGLADLTLQGLFVQRRDAFSTAAWGTVFNADRAETDDRRAYADLKCDAALTPELSVLARVYVDYYLYRGDYFWDWAEEEDEEPFPGLNKDEAVGIWWGAEAQVSRPFLEAHRLVAGVELQHNARQNQRNYDLDFPVDSLDDRHDSMVAALYLQGRAAHRRTAPAQRRRAVRPLRGVREHDEPPRRAAPLARTTIKALFGQAFRAPSAYEQRYPDGGASQKANPTTSCSPFAARRRSTASGRKSRSMAGGRGASTGAPATRTSTPRRARPAPG